MKASPFQGLSWQMLDLTGKTVHNKISYWDSIPGSSDHSVCRQETKMRHLGLAYKNRNPLKVPDIALLIAVDPGRPCPTNL